MAKALSVVRYNMYLPPEETISTGTYCAQIGEMPQHGKLYDKQLSLVNVKDPAHLAGNSKSHVAKIKEEKRSEQRFEIFSHPSYYLNLPTNYHLIMHLTLLLKSNVQKQG